MTQPAYSPPPYVGAPTTKKGMPGWGWALLGGGCLLVFFFTAIFAAILFPVFAQAREKARQTQCMSNLKQQSLAVLMYAQDNNDIAPPKSRWMDCLTLYTKAGNGKIYHCPSVRSQGADAYGYAYNSNVADKPMSKIADQRAKMLIYDSSTLTRNASDAGTSLPENGRHSKGNNIAFADGHVKWFRLGSEAGKYGDGRPGVTP